MALLLRGSLLSQIGGRDEEAQRCFLDIEARKKAIKIDLYVVPYARYELAMLYHRIDKPDTARVVKELKHASSRKGDYNFDVQLSLRIHLANYQFGHMQAQDDGAASLTADGVDDGVECDDPETNFAGGGGVALAQSTDL